MIPIEIKNIKKGQVFYERGCADWYSLSALEDAYFKGNISINGDEYRQYTVKTVNEFGEILHILITEGLAHYNGKYYTNGND